MIMKIMKINRGDRMGFLDKVKNMFTEEIEETPIKKEVMKVEIPAPTVEEQKKEVVAENEVLVKEEKPQAPVFFDDKDFANLEKKEAPKPKPKKLEDKYKGKEEEKKVFRPTPIISPVYGVLDKNYRKDDIAPKKAKPVVSSYDTSNLTIDDVRRKAYGTLEEELEVIIPGDDYEITEEPSIISDIEETEDSLIDLDYQPRFAKHEEPELVEDDNEDLFDEIKEPEEVDSNDEIFEELHEEVKEDEEELTDSDLFNLIDSMYDKKDDE